MPTVLQFRRGTTSQNNSFTGALGEITYDTDKDVLRVHDGSTAGGFSMVSASSTDTFTNKTLTSPNITTAILPTSADGATIGSATKEFSDLFLADAGTIQLGNDQDVVITHVADSGFTIKNTNTADNSTALITIQTGETDIQADDIIGQIDFQAPDESQGTDAVLVAAGLLAKSEGEFSTSNNATSLIFKTGASETATEKVAVRSNGDVRILTDAATLAMGADQDVTIKHVADSGLTLKNSATADDKPFTLTIQTGETDIAADDVLGAIQFQAPDEGTGTDAITVAAAIKAVSEGDFSASSNATKISFLCGNSEAATEKAKIVGSTGKFHATPDSILLIKNSSGSTLKTVNGHAAI
tara:strand:+ start:3252 stop:4319 length:1068 start_codon:yes stop_codon:yes gene_type:complete